MLQGSTSSHEKNLGITHTNGKSGNSFMFIRRFLQTRREKHLTHQDAATHPLPSLSSRASRQTSSWFGGDISRTGGIRLYLFTLLPDTILQGLFSFGLNRTSCYYLHAFPSLNFYMYDCFINASGVLDNDFWYLNLDK